MALRAACAHCDGAPSVGGRALAASEPLYLEGEEAGRVYPVLAGALMERRYLEDGRAVSVRLLAPGDVAGTEALSHPTYRSAVESVGSARVCVVAAAEARARLRAEPEQIEALHRLLEDRVEALRERVVGDGHRSVDVRLLRLLVQLAPSKRPGEWFRLPLAQTQLAGLIGAAPETVSRAMRRLRERGALEVKGRTVRLSTECLPNQEET